MYRIYEDVTHYSYPERDEKVHCETKYKDPIILGTVRRNTKILNIFICLLFKYAFVRLSESFLVCDLCLA